MTGIVVSATGRPPVAAPDSPFLCGPWATLADIPQARRAAGISDDDLATSLVAASEVLYHLTGRQFPGVCERTVSVAAAAGRDRPASWHVSWGTCCGTGYGYAASGAGASVDRGQMRNGCCRPAEVALPDYPVREVREVTEAGTALPWTAYELRDHRRLVRLDGGGWPTCGAGLEVSYVFGADPGEMGRRAAAILAAELARAFVGMETQLPQRVTSVTRQGVSKVVLDPMSFLDKGRTGITGVDMFLRTVNPAGLKHRPAVWSPDIATASSVTDF